MVEIKNVAITSCTHCAKKFEFEAADAGFSTACPYCGIETLLTNETPKAPEPPPKPVIKGKLVKGALVGGVEGNLDMISDCILAVGICGGILALIGVFIAAVQGELPAVGIVSGISFAIILMAQGWIFSVLMKAAAEMIRLLKKQNGLKYSGLIAEPKDSHPYCSNCKSHAFSDKGCSVCGAVFEP